MTSSRELPDELWLHVFTFLSLRDRLSARATCTYFKHLLDKSRPLWKDFRLVLRHFSKYNRAFWRSLAQRHVGGVVCRSAKRKHVRALFTWLPALHALRLDDWRDEHVTELHRFRHLRRLALTSCPVPLKNVDFLFPLSGQLTHLSLCQVQLTCASSHLLASVGQLTRLTSLVLHHDGSVRVATLGGVLSQLTELRHLSCTMITYKTLSRDFFGHAHLPAGGALPLTDLQLLNYDAVVTSEVLAPLSRLLSLSVFHLYSVPGPVCHMTTWMTSLPQLHSLSVYGGHPLSAYADLLPASLRSLTLNVDLQHEDLQVVSHRVPHLEHLHLEPWSSSSTLIGLLPHLFPHLRTLRIRHHLVSDVDFLSLQQLQHLNKLEVLDSFHRPDPSDPSWVVYEPSPGLQENIRSLQRATNHRVHVVTSSHRDSLSCDCV